MACSDFELAIEKHLANSSSEGKDIKLGRYRFNLGVTYRRIGKLEKSIEQLKRANEMQSKKAAY